MNDENSLEKLNQATGTVKEGVGKLIGDKELENEGAAEKVVSKGRRC